MVIFPNDETGDFFFVISILAAFFGVLWLAAYFGPSIPRLAGQIGLLAVFSAILATLMLVRVRMDKKGTKKV